jgi:hypothetical protein
LRESAAGAVLVPFVLNQARIRHQREHRLRRAMRYCRGGSAGARISTLILGPETMHYEAEAPAIATLPAIAAAARTGTKIRGPGQAEYVVIEHSRDMSLP